MVNDASAHQILAHYQKWKKSIWMLILILIVFRIRWFPHRFCVVLISTTVTETDRVIMASTVLPQAIFATILFILCCLTGVFIAKLRSIAFWCTKFLLLSKDSEVHQQVLVQKFHELQELQISSLPWLPLTIPESQVFKMLRLATGEGQSQVCVQGNWSDPDVSMEQEEESSTKDAYVYVQVQTISL